MPARRPGFLSSILLQLNPAPILLQPLWQLCTLGRGGRGGGQRRLGGGHGSVQTPGQGQRCQQWLSQWLMNSPVFSGVLQREHKIPGGRKDPQGFSRGFGVRRDGSRGVAPSPCLGPVVRSPGRASCAGAMALPQIFGLGMGFARGRWHRGRGKQEQPRRLPGKL